MCTYKPQWKKHQVELMRKTGFATIHAEMSCNTIESMAAMLEECRVHALSSGNVALLDKLELFLDDYKANPPEWKPQPNEWVETTIKCLVRKIEGDSATVGIAHHDYKIPVGNLRQVNAT